ncbi:hypothetical protein QE386_001846 [Pseudoxanthomonas winnipegensis]|nr:hypothetical protein [Pseudoxanthomonas winnipegensis]MDQ1133251.1 hypothetical protein [Pseudoxanthomonas winnipegensis]
MSESVAETSQLPPAVQVTPDGLVTVTVLVTELWAAAGNAAARPISSANEESARKTFCAPRIDVTATELPPVSKTQGSAGPPTANAALRASPITAKDRDVRRAPQKTARHVALK